MTTWGIISTADINRKLIPGAQASPKVGGVPFVVLRRPITGYADDALRKVMR